MDRNRGVSRRTVLAVVGTVGAAGCLSGGRDEGGATRSTPSGTDTETPPETTAAPTDDSAGGGGWTAPTDSPLDADVRRETVVEGLAVPWDLAFAPTGDLFLTERVGRLLRIADGGSEVVARPSGLVDSAAVGPDEEGGWWAGGGENGLLGVAVHPDYPDPAHVFVQYTHRDGPHNRVVRYDAAADDPAATETVLVGEIPSEAHHAGGRIAFGPDGYLWVTCGDAGEEALARRPGSLAGSILRITPDGDPAPGNPDVAGGDPRVYSYGHRNPQGLAWLPDGTPLATEHGPAGHDVVNRLVAGGDYGWPEARRPEEYGGDGFARPAVNTTDDTWAPSGGVFYTGDAVPAWRNRLLVGTLGGQRLEVVTLTPTDGRGADPALPPADGDAARRFDADWLDDRLTATSHRTLADELGRIRAVAQGPDGAPYAITSNRDGRARDPFPRAVDDVLVRFEA